MKGTEEFWDRMATSYGEGGAVGRSLRGLDELASYLSETLRIDKGSSVLDLCCGNGLITNILARNGASVTGVDISGEMLKKGAYAAEILELAGVRYLQSDAAGLPFADNTFDAAFCFSSFQLFPSFTYADRTLKELMRVTKPAGNILIGELPWKGTSGYKIWNLIRSRGGGTTEGYIPFLELPVHKKVWERSKLLFRRFSGRRVASDEWLWYDRDFFIACKGDKFEHIHMKLSSKKRFVKYQFDVILSNHSRTAQRG